MADLWTFPEGSVGHSDSVKGYRVDCSDEAVGTVAWADYKPGESYLVVDVGDGRNHLVPAGTITAVDHGAGTVTLKVTATEVRSTPPHEDIETAYGDARSSYVGQFERGMLGGGFVWPYVDE
ncbi:MAG TPA: hypothetical protein VGH82_07485 [Gaiellaceae bacterium]|jgi:hypothetical protein